MKKSSRAGSSEDENLQKRILDFLARYPNELFRSKELFRRLGIKDQSKETWFKQELRALQDTGKIIRLRGKQYGHLHTPEYREGRLQITRHGTGSLTTADGDIIFIPSELLKDAADGDLVEAALRAQGTKQKERDDRRQGEIIRVLEREQIQIVGTLQRIRKQFLVVPDNKKISREILIGKEALNDAHEGDKVVVEQTRPAGRYQTAEGRITDILGKAGELSVEILSVAREFNLPLSISQDVLQESNSFPSQIPEEEIQGRLDLRSLLCFTIDPEDAKDFDDAVSIETLPDGNFLLGVHIADVSYYIREDSLLDKEALQRGTSVYFPNGVIPMLPERLSSDLCSLRPGLDRLTFSVLMTVSPRGIIKDYKIRESIIRSKRRYTYEEVQTLIDEIVRQQPAPAEEKELYIAVAAMYHLSAALTKKRMKEGSIDFDSVETKFQFDTQGKPIAIIKKVRLESNRLVEEFMLLANQVVAQHIGYAKKEEHQKPFLYRIHDSPDPDRIRELALFVKKFGFSLNVDSGVTSQSLQKLLQEVKGSEVENVINEVVLRSMAKAIYSERNIGHYGLAFDYYAHFTSPIRRYPDLIVHRMLKRYRSELSPAEREDLRKRLPSIAKQSSERERTAMAAERAAVKVVQVEFMKKHLGDEFPAVISGVAQYGLFIQINDLHVEGMVHVREINDDYYQYDEKQYALIGKRRRKMFRLGDPVFVKVSRVDLEARQIDFILVNNDTERAVGQKKAVKK
jgi:ribonuclease R